MPGRLRGGAQLRGELVELALGVARRVGGLVGGAVRGRRLGLAAREGAARLLEPLVRRRGRGGTLLGLGAQRREPLLGLRYEALELLALACPALLVAARALGIAALLCGGARVAAAALLRGGDRRGLAAAVLRRRDAA